MRIAFLGSADSWYFRDLQRAAGSAIQLHCIPFLSLVAQVETSAARIASAGQPLAQFDCVLVRSMPPGSLEQVVFRMDALARLEAAGARVVNSPKSMEIAIDKYLATARLAAAGLATPRTMVCQTADDAMAAFDELGGDVVIKPLFGSEGRGITRVSDVALALRAFKMLQQLGAVIYLQQFIGHEGADLRLLVLGEKIWGIRRHNPIDWRTNMSRGATAAPLEVSDQLARIARRAADAVGADFAGVDVLPGQDGELYTIEVNAVPGWKAVAATLKTDVAAELLQFLQRY